MTPTPAQLGLDDPRQVAWAIRSLAAARPFCAQHGLTADQTYRACDIMLATELTESNLWMYANKYNPESLRLPHDRIGEDHGSVGLFQQQVGGAVHSTANWGTTAQCMDGTHSVQAFLAALLRWNWSDATNWAAAQKVQGSFDANGGNYRIHDAQAITIRKGLWAAASPPAPKPPTHPPVGTYRVRNGDTLTTIAHRYPQAWITADSIARIPANHIHDKNHIEIGQLLVIG